MNKVMDIDKQTGLLVAQGEFERTLIVLMGERIKSDFEARAKIGHAELAGRLSRNAKLIERLLETTAAIRKQIEGQDGH